MVEPLANLGPTTTGDLTPLELLPASDTEVLRATFADTITRNPTPSAYRYLFDTPDQDEGEIIDAKEARQELEEEGLKLVIPDEGISKAYFDVLRERKREEIGLQNIFARSKGGLTLGVGQFLTGLAGSVVDPINIASAFIPVVGHARYANMIKNASGAAGRAGVRARVGLAEGAVGAAIVEPIVYGVAQSEQADYTLYDSLINVGFGAALGAGLHPTVGAVADKYSIKFDPDGSPRAKGTPEPVASFGDQFSRLSPDNKKIVMQRVIELEANGKAADVGKIIEALNAEQDIKTSAPERGSLPADTPEPIRIQIKELKTERAKVTEDLNSILMARSDTDDFIISNMAEEQRQKIEAAKEKIKDPNVPKRQRKKAENEYKKLIKDAKEKQPKLSESGKEQRVKELEQEKIRLTEEINALYPEATEDVSTVTNVSGTSNRLNTARRAAADEQANASRPENLRVFSQEDIDAVDGSFQADDLEDLQTLINNATELEIEAQERAAQAGEEYVPLEPEENIQEIIQAARALAMCKSGLT